MSAIPRAITQSSHQFAEYIYIYIYTDCKLKGVLTKKKKNCNHNEANRITEQRYTLRKNGLFYKQGENLWFESASELCRPCDLRLSTKLEPTFEDGRCHVISVTDPYGRILDFPDLSYYFFLQAAPQLYLRG
jgi:hypothetical protein